MATSGLVRGCLKIVSINSKTITHRVPPWSCATLQKFRHYSDVAADPMAPPSPEGVEKVFSPKLHQIVNEISGLTLLEVADLNELLKKTLNIQDAPVTAMGAMPVAAAKEEEEEVEPEQVKTSFTVKLSKFDETKKVALIKEIKSLIEGMNLVQAKKFVESAPAVLKADIAKDEAESLKAAIEKVGGTAEIL